MTTAFKPQIFIGSSKEAEHVAKKVATALGDFADCKVWSSTFEYGNSAYDDLLSNLALYDYGILIASDDDTTLFRGKKVKTPRDNVIFEFGLFAGKLGNKRSFLMTEAGVKLPSDLNGITLPFYKSDHKKGMFDFSCLKSRKQQSHESIVDCALRIKAYIETRSNIFDYGFIPSTSLAFGYYNNFILKAMSGLLGNKKLSLGNTCAFPKNCQKLDAESSPKTQVVDGLSYQTVELTILIPTDLSSDMFDKIRAHRSDGQWELIKIDAGSFRPFDFYIQIEKSQNGLLHLSDMPITLNALNDSIRSFIGKNYIGIAEAERLLEMRELRVFHDVLQFLVSSNPITKKSVKIEMIDI